MIYKLDTSGAVLASFPAPGSGLVADMAWDGVYLWVVDTSNVAIFKIDASGNVIGSIPAPGGAGHPTGLAWDGAYLWVASTNTDMIYKVDTSGNIIESFLSPDNNPSGLAWDGNYLWLSGENTDMIYKIIVDNLIGNETNINSTEPTNITINGTSNLSQAFEGVLHIEFTQANHVVAEFDYNFSEQVLNLSEVFVERNLASASKGYIMVAGLPMTGDETKTLYFENIDGNLASVCIKDVEMTDIGEMSKNCQGQYETLVPCSGVLKNGYMCTYTDDGYYKVTGLNHSGVREQCGDEDEDGYGTYCSKGPDCDDNNASEQQVCDPLPPSPGVGYFADGNGNKTVDEADINIINLYILNKPFQCGTLPDCFTLDVNGDGYVTGADVTMMRRLLLGKNVNVIGAPANINNIDIPSSATAGMPFNVTVSVTASNGMPRPGIGVLFAIDPASTPGVATLYGRDPADGNSYISSDSVFELTNSIPEGGKATIQVNPITDGTLILKTSVPGDLSKKVSDLNGQDITITVS